MSLITRLVPGFLLDYFRPKMRSGQAIRFNYPLIVKVGGRTLLECLQIIARSEEQEDEHGDVRAFRGLNGMLKVNVDMADALAYLEEWKTVNFLTRPSA